MNKLIIGMTVALALAAAWAEDGVRWIDGRDLPTEGRAFRETIGGPYGRVPLSFADRVTPADRLHGQDSCGVTFRFRTDSRKLRFRWTLGNAGRFVADRYMTQMAMGGIDVYVENAEGCHLHNDADSHGGPDIGKPDAATEYSVPWTPGDTAIVYLPIRGIVTSFSLGVDEGAKVERSPRRRQPQPKPVVVYGTSVMHGGCVSRPGLVITTWASRLLDVEFVSLAFSGSGKMEPIMSELVAETDASVYVLECLGNLKLAELKERCEPFLRDLKRRRPETPILLCENCDVRQDEWRGFQRGVYDKLKAEDPRYWANLHYLAREQWLPLDWDLTLDRTHPNDAGSYFASRALAKEVGRLLGGD